MILETDPVRARKIARAELELYLGLENYPCGTPEIPRLWAPKFPHPSE
jgi:hypothetical protein